ncbi:hypothetical protein AB0N50_28065 [Streptomyces pharetrae]|uniref:hypothetical protein n=1 Tax=Streptomyces pharetrae TaxID=291370 RepID=UPI0034614C78
MAPAEDTPADQRIAGTLCTPRGTRAGTVQLLVHGGTYDRDYWSVRARTGSPTYVESATRAGHATLASDRLGTGASSAPHSSRFTETTHEWVTLQLIRTLATAATARSTWSATPSARRWPAWSPSSTPTPSTDSSSPARAPRPT